jgi:hypothetical protein
MSFRDAYHRLRETVGPLNSRAVPPPSTATVVTATDTSRSFYLAFFSSNARFPLADFYAPEALLAMIETAPLPGGRLNAQAAQALAPLVGFILKRKDQIAPLMIEYLKTHPEHFSVLAYVVYPGLFGYFTTLGALEQGHDFLLELVSAGGWALIHPFLQGYFASAVVFLDHFWRTFDAAIPGRRQPPLPQLISIVISALNSSITFLAPPQLMLLLTLASGRPQFFLNVLLNDILLSSFDGFHRSPKIPKSQFTKLVRHLTKDLLEEGAQLIITTVKENPYSVLCPVPYSELCVLLTAAEWRIVVNILALSESAPRVPEAVFCDIKGSDPLIVLVPIKSSPKDASPPFFQGTSVQPVTADKKIINLSLRLEHILTTTMEHRARKVAGSPARRRHHHIIGTRGRPNLALLDELTADIVPLITEDRPTDTFRLRRFKTGLRPFIGGVRDYAYMKGYLGLVEAKHSCNKALADQSMVDLLRINESIIWHYLARLLIPLLRASSSQLTRSPDLAPAWRAVSDEVPAFWRAILRLAGPAPNKALAPLKADPVNWAELQCAVRELGAVPMMCRLFTVADLLTNFADMGDSTNELFCSLIAEGNSEDSPPRLIGVLLQTLVALWECELKEDRHLLVLPAPVRNSWAKWRTFLAGADPELFERIKAVLKPAPQESKRPNS